jgi:uncharacterized protein with PIN domain
MTEMSSQAPVRLLCDEMLARLGRWLRAAGYDTEIAQGSTSDKALVAQCAAEGRVLLTRDRHLAEIAAARGVCVLRLADSSIEVQARTLRHEFGINWQYAPFTRCLVDNAPLGPAAPEAASKVPPSSRATGGPLRVCPSCGRLYWPGGHVRRMLARLSSFNTERA